MPRILSPEQALVALSRMAATYQVGSLSDDYIVSLLSTLATAANLPQASLETALGYWGVESDHAKATAAAAQLNYLRARTETISQPSGRLAA